MRQRCIDEQEAAKERREQKDVWIAVTSVSLIIALQRWIVPD
jgi:hypothetical protein